MKSSAAPLNIANRHNVLRDVVAAIEAQPSKKGTPLKFDNSHLHKKDIHIRLLEIERMEFEAAAAELDMNMSDLFRLLIQLPTSCMDESLVHAVYIDSGLVGNMWTQMRRWGHHYNQAVRALNAIQKRTQTGFIPEPEYSEILDDIRTKLEEVATTANKLDEDIKELDQHPLICGQPKRRPGRPRKDERRRTSREYNDGRYLD